MTAHAPSPALKRALLIGSALGGLSIAVSQVGAQAFNGTPKTVAGSVSYDRATAGVETITVESQSAIINWTPNVGGNPIVFLPAGNVATFTNGVSNGDYVVLNRILTQTPIRFDGTVISRLQDFALGTSGPGGTILFSSPGGIIIGSTAIFDVGSLVLTSLDVVDDGAGNFYDFATRGVTFAGGSANPNAAIVTLPGSQISALTQGSFVAMVAPRIVHGGSVRVNGSAAFIAGEAVQMRVNQGLFDIIVDTGSDNATPLVHTGSTGGPASTGPGDLHGIYMVAMPKNQAITAILQGSIGFDPAVNAAIENGVIVLSAGFNIAGGAIDRFGDFTPPPAKGLDASFEIRGGTITSDLFGAAVTDMLASGAPGTGLNALQDLSLFGGRRAHLFAGAGQTVTVGGNVLVSAARRRTVNPAEFDLTGGEALIFALANGAVTIAGNATVDASAQGIVDQVNSRAGNGTGGTAGIFADGGSVRINGDATVLATGNGGVIDFYPDQGGDGTGGTVLVEGRNGGGVRVDGNLTADASGIGSRENGAGAVPVTGATGTGGNISVAATGGGSVRIGGTAGLTSTGTGGEMLSGPAYNGGSGQGGIISIRAGGTVTFAGASVIRANAFGGLGPNGGAAKGGQILVDALAGQIDFTGDTSMNADATGSDAGNGLGGRGGDGTGGTIQVVARSGAAQGRISGGAIAVSAQGTGGAGGSALIATPPGRGGDGHGGNIALLAEAGNGMLQLGAVTAFANGIGGRGGPVDFPAGTGGRGGDGTGGNVQLGTVAGPSAPTLTGSARFASVDLAALGQGGKGGTGAGLGGTGAGGSVALVANGALTSIQTTATMSADATGGAGGDAVAAGDPSGPLGQADGGQIVLAAAGVGATPGTLNAGTITGTASATGAANNGNSPGEWHVSSSGGSAINLANLTLSATATGTPATRPFSSIEPLGGTINVTQIASLTTQSEIRVIGDGAGRITGGTLGLNAGDDVVITHTNPVVGGVTVDVTDFNVVAGSDFRVGAGVVTRSANRTDVRAADLAILAGRVLGREILIASDDIDIAATGGIGDAGTLLTTLLLNDTGQLAILGGTTQGPGYTLTGAEAGRIRSGTLRIIAPSLGANPALVVRDVTFNGGGAASGIGILELVTQGSIRVDGALSMANAGAADGISISARDRIEVVTPAGSVRVRDAMGNPGGRMLLASNNIWIASQAIIDQLRVNSNYTGRDADLLDNGGVDEPRGYVEAGGVILATGGTLFVQNSGPALSPAFGGVTAGAGGLVIRSTGPGLAVVTAFGRRLNPDGSLVLGEPFFRDTAYQPGNGSYTPGSTLNTCIIVTGQCGGAAGLFDTGPGGKEPITGPTGGADAISLPQRGEADDLVDTSFSSDPLIEEPVTSGSETGLPDCDRDHDGDCDED